MEATYYTITKQDIGKATIRWMGRSWLVVNFIGQILPQDVGKRVYKRGDILQVENDEQRNARIAKSTAKE